VTVNDETTRKYWFGPKDYGWGWGLPLTWQGWVVFVAYFVFILTIGLVISPATNMLGFLAAVFGASALLIAICWKTGVPPKWRWGGK
jgi:hypothetical protein